MNIVAFWKADRRPSFVYSSHGVIWRACPDILLRITIGLGVSLRSLYPKTFETSTPWSLGVSFRSIDSTLFSGNICAIEFPFSFSFFPLWCLGCLTLFCNVFLNLQYNVWVYISFWNGIVCLLLLGLHFCQVMVLKVHLELTVIF